jgi:hypothetical protein
MTPAITLDRTGQSRQVGMTGQPGQDRGQRRQMSGHESQDWTVGTGWLGKSVGARQLGQDRPHRTVRPAPARENGRDSTAG